MHEDSRTYDSTSASRPGRVGKVESITRGKLNLVRADGRRIPGVAVADGGNWSKDDCVTYQWVDGQLIALQRAPYAF